MDLTAVDPEVAAAEFRRDLDAFWANGRPQELGWKQTKVNDLVAIVEMTATQPDGTRDVYYVKLGAFHYGPHPAKVNFVEPGTWADAPGHSRWFPLLQNFPTWFHLHAAYPAYPDRVPRQLVCFSHNLDYYVTNHSPQPTEVWVQGRHTVAASLTRVHQMLGAAHYRGPAGTLEDTASLRKAA